MIDITKLTNNDIGKWVVYDGGHYKETGRIKNWNDSYIFVVFKCDSKWHEFKNYTGEACNKDRLRFFKKGE